MLGGVTVNFFLAWIIYSMLLFSNGDTYIPADSLKYGILVDSVGQQLGLETGDKILAVDGKKTKTFRDAVLQIILGDEVTVERNGQKIDIPLSDEGKATVFKQQGRNFLSYRQKPIVDSVIPQSAALKAGIKAGDEIVGVNGKRVDYWDQLTGLISSSPNGKMNIELNRNNIRTNVELIVPEEGKIGVYPSIEDLRVTDTYSFFEAIPAGFNRTIKVLTDQVRQFKVIFNAKTEAYKQVKGPIGIVEMMPPTWDWTFFWSFLAMFSVWLAFVNLLPIPALDGGHVMFLLYEIISGRPPSQKVLETGQIIGFIFILALMAVIFGNDIWNIIKRFL